MIIKVKNMANMSTRDIFDKFLSFEFNKDYFNESVAVTDINEIIKVNKGIQTILKKGKGESLRVTVARIIRGYSVWHYDSEGNKDSFYIHSDKLKSSVKGIIIDTADRLERKDKKHNFDDKIVSGLLRIKR